MSRLMSVAMTEPAVVARIKTVTRRKGWWEDRNGRRLVKPGDHLTLVRKAMGRSRVVRQGMNRIIITEPLVKLAEVEVVDVRRELLDAITQADVALEGFPDMSRTDFVNRFFVMAQGIYPDDVVTRIEWRYVCGCGFCECGGCVL